MASWVTSIKNAKSVDDLKALKDEVNRRFLANHDTIKNFPVLGGKDNDYVFGYMEYPHIVHESILRATHKDIWIRWSKKGYVKYTAVDGRWKLMAIEHNEGLYTICISYERDVPVSKHFIQIDGEKKEITFIEQDSQPSKKAKIS